MRLLLAYIDPGAGSLVIQAIIAALVSVPFFFRNLIRSTLARLRGGTRPPGEKAAPPADPE